MVLEFAHVLYFLLQRITVEPWGFCWSMMSLMNHLSTVNSPLLFLTIGDLLNMLLLMFAFHHIWQLNFSFCYWWLIQILNPCFFGMNDTKSLIDYSCCISCNFFFHICSFISQMLMDLASQCGQISGTGFGILSNTHLTMSTKYWWETRQTWMKVKG